MCCFNRPVQGVSQTRILVAPTKDGRQITVYEHKVGVIGGGRGRKEDEEKKDKIKKEQEKAKYGNAMILPCPLKAGSKVQLLDLSKDSFSFERVENYFPKEPVPQSRGVRLHKPVTTDNSKLAVHEVGAYFVSIAENLGDLKRIDPAVFTVSENIEHLFAAHYAAGFGFIVCCFNPDKAIVDGHPIAYVHDVMPDGRFFVPCRHEHGHGTQAMETFDHFIYSLNTGKGDAGDTRDEILAAHPQWLYDKDFAADTAVTSALMAPLYAPVTALRRRRIQGKFKNDDLIFVAA